MGNEIDDIAFESLLKEKQHKELVKTLKELSQSVGKNNNKEVVGAIGELSENVKQYTSAINNLPKPEKSEVKVEMNQQDVVSSISKMTGSILKGLQRLEDKVDILNYPKEGDIEIIRNSSGVIERGKIKVNYIKPKAQA